MRAAAVMLVLFAASTCRAARADRPIDLDVDASRVFLRIVHTREVIPATPGALTLLYPKWIPGEHGPTGPVGEVAGLQLSARGKPLAWQRDPFEMFSIHCEVPAGAESLVAEFDLQLSVTEDRFDPGASATSQLAMLNWNQHVLAPAGIPSDSLEVHARLRVPEGWKPATALVPRDVQSGWTAYQPVSLTTLVDSPVLAGSHMRRFELNPGATPPATLDLAADSDAALDISDEQVAHWRALVAEAHALFGARHYRRYHFLCALSDHIYAVAIEHHESTDIRDKERSMLDPQLALVMAETYAHEYSHSWNGKYRRPRGLATPDYQTPMDTRLLWIYEGLTQYLGHVLATRAGMQSPEEFRQSLALDAADLDAQRGRDWRPLVDTGTEAQLLYNTPAEGESWRRSTDFYAEGRLLWLEVDGVLRANSGGHVTLDDFCRRFHGGGDGPPRVVPYELQDVIQTLNAMVPMDWATFFHERVDEIAPHPPLGSLANHGWQLAWRDSSSEYGEALEAYWDELDLRHSIGLRVAEKDGEIRDVRLGGPADSAGIAPGMTLVAVNGRAWSRQVLLDALRATAHGGALELLVSNAEFYSSHPIAYHGGGRWPWLDRVPGRPDALADVLRPHAAAAPRSRR
jgi:predicted metalloprotease with PDZ domain